MYITDQTVQYFITIVEQVWEIINVISESELVKFWVWNKLLCVVQFSNQPNPGENYDHYNFIMNAEHSLLDLLLVWPNWNRYGQLSTHTLTEREQKNTKATESFPSHL